MSLKRKPLRLLSMKLLFEYDFYPEEEREAQVLNFLSEQELPEEDRQFVFDRMMDAFQKIPEIDGEINDKTEGWTTARMNKVDLTLIRLAVYEMRYDPETPVKVAIDEAVELAKEYGGADSSKFVNGVLARFVKEES